MFTVYGLNGRVFSGRLEGLRELAPVQAVSRVRAIEPVQGDAALQSPGVLLAGPAPDTALPALGGAEPRASDALAAYQQAQSLGQGGGERRVLSLVEQLMSRRLHTVPLQSTLAQGLALLSRAGVGQAPVVNAYGRLVGLLLRADLLPGPQELEDSQAWQDWLGQPVAQVMWSPVPAARPDTPVREVAQALLDLRLPGLPVVDEFGNMQGFLSRSDILRALTREAPLDLWT